MKQQRTLLLFVGLPLLALLVRVTYVILAPNVDPLIRDNPLYGDASGYHLLATNLQQGLGLTWDGETPTVFRMPGYSVFLVLMYAISDSNPVPVRLVQAVFGALTCVPIFFLARELAGEKAALLAGLGVALHPLLIYMTAWLYTETLFIFLLWTGLWLFVWAMKAVFFWQSILAGFVLGLGMYIRPEVFIVPVFILVISLIFSKSIRNVKVALLVQATLILMLVPWMVRNYLHFDSFILLTTNTGTTLLGGNNPDADGGMPKEQIFVLPNMSELQSNKELTSRALDWIHNNPTAFLKLLPLKLVKFFSPAEIKTTGSILGKWTLPANLAYGIFLLIALYGGLIVQKKDVALPLFGTIAQSVCIALVYSGGTRVALPIAPALIILAVCGMVGMFSQLKPAKV